MELAGPFCPIGFVKILLDDDSMGLIYVNRLCDWVGSVFCGE